MEQPLPASCRRPALAGNCSSAPPQRACCPSKMAPPLEDLGPHPEGRQPFLSINIVPVGEWGVWKTAVWFWGSSPVSAMSQPAGRAAPPGLAHSTRSGRRHLSQLPRATVSADLLSGRGSEAPTHGSWMSFS